MTRDFPDLAPWLIQDLEDILEGQDLSLIWRRDGLAGFPVDAVDRVNEYRRMASLKTGSLFRLLGHMVLENQSMDEALTLVAYDFTLSLPPSPFLSPSLAFVYRPSDTNSGMPMIRWCSQLQNDSKNLYSSEYAKLKGSIAEDLRNHELTYPIVLGLDVPEGQWVVRALESPSSRNIRNALRVIRGDEVRKMCMEEMKRSGATVKDWLELWGRKEKLDLKA